MDTDKAMYALEKAGIKPVADYGDGLTYSDEADAMCVEVWRRAILTDKELLSIYFDDLFCDVLESRTATEEMVSLFTESFNDLRRLQDTDSHSPESYHFVMARCLTNQLANIGSLISVGIHGSLTTYLEAHKEEWLIDIASYVLDMEADAEADRADWAYECAKDAELDRRADSEN